jgi:putative periplasmic protein
MKKRILGAMFALFATGLFFAQDDMPISKKDMPSSVQRNVTRYFGKKNISSIIKDKEDGKIVYEVSFEDGTKAEFSSNGSIIEAKNHNGVPASVVPSKVQAYVRKYYPQNKIVHWEKEWNKQKVELDNDLDLEFTLKGDFLRIDD